MILRSLLLFILVVFIIIILLMAIGLFYPDSFTHLNNISSTLDGFTAPLIGIFGTLLLYITIQQQFELIKQPEQQKIRENEQLKELILNDLRLRVRPEIIKVKSEILIFLKTDNYYWPSYPLSDMSNLNIEIFSKLPITNVYESFKDKKEFLDVILIYERLKLVNNYALINLFQPFINDYTGTVTYKSIMDKHGDMIKTVPNHVDEILDLIDNL